MSTSATRAPGPPEPGRRRVGRPVQPVLSSSSIADAAISLMDASGDFTMQQLARRLGVRPSALYNHVTGKEDVLARVRELVSDRINVSVFDELPLFEALPVWARSYRDAFAMHSATIAVFATMALAGARRTIQMYERVIQAFLDADWPDADVLTTVVALENFILGAAMDAVAPPDMFHQDDADDSPAFSRAIAARRAAHGQPVSADLAFDAGLDALLRGLRVRFAGFDAATPAG